MKVKICAVIILMLLFVSVFLNTVILDKQISLLYQSAKELDESNLNEENIDKYSKQ